MKHDISKELYGIRLRPVTRDDVDLILELRGDDELCRFMGEISLSRDVQLGWLEKYFEKPGDYYFVIETVKEGSGVGLAGIYDVVTAEDGRRTGEWGRWVIRPGVFAAPASALISFRIAFDDLRLDRLFYWTSLENRKVIAFHEKIGARRLERRLMDIRGERVECGFYEITPDIRHGVESRLERIAAQAERMLSGL